LLLDFASTPTAQA